MHDFLCAYSKSRVKFSFALHLFMGIACLTISSFLGVRKMSLDFVTFGDGSGCCSITIHLSLLLLSILIEIEITVIHII